MIAIFDIDGVLADNTHTAHLDCTKPAQNAKFAAAVPNVKPISTACGVLTAFRNCGVKVYIFTARSEALREVTEEWLIRNYLSYEYLFMRPIGDSLPSADLKEKYLKILFRFHLPQNFKTKKIIAYEDDAEVAAMYKKHGIKVFMPYV